MRRPLPVVLGLVVSLGTAPVVNGGEAPGATEPATSPAPSRIVQVVSERPSARDAVLLRVSTIGGIAGETMALLAIPAFTLYGDGTVLIPRTTFTDDDVERTTVLTATLDAELTERVLFAASDVLGPRLRQDGRSSSGGEDATTTVFSIDAGDLKGALFIDDLGADADDAFLVELVRTLTDPGFWQVVDREPRPFEPAAYLASFVEDDPELPSVIGWPWESDVPAAALIPAVDGGLVPTVTLTPAQVAAVTDLPAGPRSDIVLSTPDGRALRMFLRPLLPDEFGAGVDPAGQ